MRELITAINRLLSEKGLLLLDADGGGDDFAFILLPHGEYDRLQQKYGPIERWIQWPRLRDHAAGRDGISS